MEVKILLKNGYRIADLNRRKAIRERCLNCSGWSVVEVEECFFKHCSLYYFRSGKGKQNPKERAKAIQKYCLWCFGAKRSEVIKCVAKYCPLFAYRRYRIDSSVKVLPLLKKEHIDDLSETVSVYVMKHMDVL